MKFDINWVQCVENEKCRILASLKSPLQILIEVFELCQDDFDVTMLKDKQPQLYQILQEFCSHVPANDQELRVISRDLTKFFSMHKDEIRECDVYLYYALLNFIDMLKSKRMYFAMLKT